MYCQKILTIIIFTLLLCAVILSILSFTKNTWWIGDVTAITPIHKYNVTNNTAGYNIFISIRIRTGLEETCWHVEQTKKELDYKFNGKFFPPVNICFDKFKDIPTFEWIKDLNEKGQKPFQTTKTCIIMAITFSCLAVLLQLVNIFLGKSCIIKTNIVLALFSSICTMVGLIIFNENINYNSLFMDVEMNIIPILITQNKNLGPQGQSLLGIILTKLYIPKLENKFMKGDSFILLWISEILFIVSFILSILEHFCAIRSSNRDHKEDVINSSGISKKFRLPRWGSSCSLV